MIASIFLMSLVAHKQRYTKHGREIFMRSLPPGLNTEQEIGENAVDDAKAIK